MPVWKKSALVSCSTPSATWGVFVLAGWPYTSSDEARAAKSMSTSSDASAIAAGGDTQISRSESTKLATTVPLRNRHSDSTRAGSMNPEPCTVSSVPPCAGPETTLSRSTVALW